MQGHLPVAEKPIAGSQKFKAGVPMSKLWLLSTSRGADVRLSVCFGLTRVSGV